MSKLGSADNPLKVAIVGAGPSGFYAADALINSKLKVEVNLLEKLCAPYGLVRTGVARRACGVDERGTSALSLDAGYGPRRSVSNTHRRTCIAGRVELTWRGHSAHPPC